MSQVGNMPSRERALHALNRLGFGPAPGDIDRIDQIGADQWISRQLESQSMPEPPALTANLAAMDTLGMSPIDLFTTYWMPVQQAKGDMMARRQARQRANVVVQEAAEARLMRALYSPRQLHEVMTAFWFNHFNVFARKGPCAVWVGAYEEEAIRPHALGRFRDLLGATAKHPAMLFYLDNWQNTGPDSPGKRGPFQGINENYAREVMELHTVGVNGGYRQADVTALAHILTGWGIRRRRFARAGGGGRFGANPWWMRRRAPLMSGAVIDGNGFFFDPRRHDFGDQIFLGRTFQGSGIAEGEAALDMLAASPATANHISYQLAQYFVADDPPPALVTRMAARFARTNGDIRATLEALFASPEFWDTDAFGAKFKTPYEFVISSARLTGARVSNYRPLAGEMALLGMPLYGCLTPDGYKNTRAAWLNPDAMMMRLSFASALGMGHLPIETPPFEELSMEPAHRVTDGTIQPTRFVAAPMQPPEPAQLAMALGGGFSQSTSDAIGAAPVNLRSALILGSPEFMTR